MTSKMKGIYRGFKFISRLFVVKEREMEIGYPTDVKHVAHVGLDGPDGTAPAWMNEYKSSSSFSLSSVGSMGGSCRDPSTDFERSFRRQQTSHTLNTFSSTDLLNAPKKQKHKNRRSSSSTKKSSSSPMSISSRSLARLRID